MSSPPRRVRRRPAAVRPFVILASRFNASITRALVHGARRTLRAHGVADRSIRVVWAPGAFELPVMAARLLRRRPAPQAIIAVGAILRGQTTQYQVLAHAAALGLTQVAVQTGVPVTFGVIVAETAAQARARSGSSPRNRGAEAARAALAVLAPARQPPLEVAHA